MCTVALEAVLILALLSLGLFRLLIRQEPLAITGYDILLHKSSFLFSTSYELHTVDLPVLHTNTYNKGFILIPQRLWHRFILQIGGYCQDADGLAHATHLNLLGNSNIDQRRSLAPIFPMWLTIPPVCVLFEGVPYRCLPVCIAVQILSR